MSNSLRPKFLNCEVTFGNNYLLQNRGHCDIEVLVPVLANKVADDVDIRFDPSDYPNVTYNHYQAVVSTVMEDFQNALMDVVDKYHTTLRLRLEDLKK